jgi:hypothetical protein
MTNLAMIVVLAVLFFSEFRFSSGFAQDRLELVPMSRQLVLRLWCSAVLFG